MNRARPIITKAKLDNFVALGLDWLGWLLAIMLKLGAPRRSRTMRRFVEKLERHVEAVIFLMAMPRLKPRGPASRRPLNVSPGFRAIATAHHRLLFKRAGVRARRPDLQVRVLRLISALANPERHIARIVRRCQRGFCASWLTACAPPALTLAADALRALAFADST